jgi:hypothetical protein
MAFYPCSNHHAAYRGPSYAAYPAMVDGALSDRRHLRMCQPCFGAYLEAIAEHLTEVNFDPTVTVNQTEERNCSFCGAASFDRTVFVTAYPKGEPERAFYGRCCLECEAKAKAEVLLS